MTSGPQTGSGEAPEAVATQDPPRGQNGVDADAASAPRSGPDDAPPTGTGDGGGNAPPAERDAPDAAANEPSSDAADDGAVPGGGGASADADEAPAEPTLEERLAAAEALADEHWNGRLRLQAELENQRKRASRDVQNARKFGLEPLINDLLPVVDSMEMGLQAGRADNATIQSLREGNELTLKMFASMLDKHGIAEVNPVGEKFDPEFHQAMSMQAVEGATPNTVVQVLQKGYTLNERLLRPALVMVAK